MIVGNYELTVGGDLITAIDGKPVQRQDDLSRAMARKRAGDTLSLTVIRGGQPKEIPLRDLVPGDLVKLSSGDMIPGDVRLVSAKDLFVIQATLTGESLPVEKTDAPDARPSASAIERNNLCFLGTSVESGAATAVIIATGAQTYFGKVARSLAGQPLSYPGTTGVPRPMPGGVVADP